MLDGRRLGDGPLDPSAGVDVPVDLLGWPRETDRIRTDVRVIRASEGEVVPDLPEVLDVDELVEPCDERGHVEERDGLDAMVAQRGRAGDRPGGSVDRDRGLGLDRRKHPHVEDHFGQSDYPVPADRGEPVVVEEQPRDVRPWAHWWAEPSSVHVGVPAGLEHQLAAEMIEIGLRICTSLDHRLARYLGQAGDNDPEGLASGM